ncbi:lytic murein transglycosylase [Streptomyces paromomycinus]|uniref:lytic murein transglycosylase n=1 Tax=Streptomyces paromomycinus TaxID=92743 RepID=UPI000F62537F
MCALAAGLTAAVAVNPLPLGGPARAGADEAGPGPGSPQSRHRGDPALDLPNLLKEGDEPQGPTGDGVAAPGSAGIPATALAAYRKAEGVLRGSQPSCRLPWELVAGIGRVESVHASGYGLRGDGSTARPIRGPRLDGVQFALIRDTDGGRWDGDAVFDRAVGPMQFIPSTWGSWGADGNGDGVKDPNNIFDAALGTARYLCAGDRDLSRSADLDRAVLSYNNSRAYVNAVRKWMDTYRGVGVVETPDDAPAAPHRPDPADRTSGVRPGPGPLPGRGQGQGRGQGPVSPAPQRRADKPVPEPAEKPKPVEKPEPTEKPKPAEKPKPVVDHRTVTRLEPLGSRELEAEVGQPLARRPQVRVVDAHGHAVPGARITFRIGGTGGVGGTGGIRFAAAPATTPGTTLATVTSDPHGTATAPALQAGDRPGRYPVVATAPGVRGPAAVFTATVRPAAEPTADRLELWDPETANLPELLRAGTGSRFPGLPSLRATDRARPASGVRITATVLPADREEGAVGGTVGPCFEGAHGEEVRTLTLPPAGADGRVTLPTLFTDQRPGTYTLRLTTPSGTVLDFPLTVTPPGSGPRTS